MTGGGCSIVLAVGADKRGGEPVVPPAAAAGFLDRRGCGTIARQSGPHEVVDVG
jgi:hypothetical protein